LHVGLNFGKNRIDFLGKLRKIEKIGNRHLMQLFYLAFGYKKDLIPLDFTIFQPQHLQKIKLPFIFSLTFGRDLYCFTKICAGAKPQA